MQRLLLLTAIPWLAAALPAAEESAAAGRAADTIILDEAGVRNLRIETAVVEEREFETTVFAIGRIEEVPSRHSSVSSRIPGRAVAVHVIEGDQVEKGQVLAEVESRQPGNPPPVIRLEAGHRGLVIKSNVHLGQPVEPDMELFDISDRSEMWAVAKIPEQEAAAVSEGTLARIHIPALGSGSVEAQLTRYGVSADRHAGTIEGIFLVPNPDGRLHPGMRAEFSIVTGRRGGVLAVPRSAVQGDPLRRIVFVKDFELPNTFIRAPVELGEQNDRFVEILGGLFPGDEVVTSGSYPLSFAGGGAGMSLKEALDAAHGHEHNPDGTRIGGEEEGGEEAGHQEAGHQEQGHDHEAEAGAESLNRALLVYSGVVTLVLVVALQRLWSRRGTPVTP